MEKNIFRGVYERRSVFTEAIMNFFYNTCSKPRMVIEVFTRRKMGRRYFRVGSVVKVFIVLFIIPILLHKIEGGFHHFYRDSDRSSFWEDYLTWYLFLALFLWCCRRRAQETYTHSNVYDIDRFSLSEGIVHPIFYNLPFFKTKPTTYQVQVFIEPGLFFLIGIVLHWLGQPVGWLLIICSICYGFSYEASYRAFDNYYQNILDKIILTEELERSFIFGYKPDATRGVHFKRKPGSENLRRKMASKFFSERDVEDAEYTVL